MTRKNRATAIAFVEAVGAFDVNRLDQLLAPEARYWVAGRPREQYIPREHLLDAIEQMGNSLFDGPICFTVHATTTQGERVAIEASSKARLRDGRDYGNVYHFLFEFTDGRISLGREYADTQILAQLAS